ncbi:tRNA synthetases class II family protein [Mycobacterium xenopi 4042]|uniref:tRNA synthetases class II family protein n=1 Tax=Mycobacterium xenopi 4042 TaxID=1299334 RepID=X8AM01_MYCXE|nr:tRNA synthetases class II family protein [Mycobacterium xenopi 4042]
MDPPLFEPADEATAAGEVTVGTGAWTAVHHAFTAPKPEWEDRIESDPGAVLADAYDIVCNGHEIGGGSIRIHRRDIQERVFAVMGLDKVQAEEKFGFLLEAFMFGAPRTAASRSGGTGSPRCWRDGFDPRGHRVPQDRRRGRPADRGARADHRAAAQGVRHRRRS